MTDDNALMTIPQEETAVVRVEPSPEAFAQAFDDYIEIQKIIDARMPDAIMKIKDKKFRKKAYWRAVAKGFGVNVECIKESSFERAGDWGYRVLYRATSPNGQHAEGDGTCMASEKARKDGSMVDATDHNVRGHAHTRAFNRAVSNLVGFGEVSAEEMIQEWQGNRAPKAVTPTPQPSQNAPQRGKSGSGGSREWDGNLRFKSGKNKGKKWAEVESGFLEWAVGQDGAIKDMAAKEIARRALEESREGNDEPDMPPEPPWEDV